MNTRTRQIGITGSILGIIAGVADTIFGKYILQWVGNKEETFVLGLITILLSGITLLIFLQFTKKKSYSSNQNIGIFLGCFIPTIICFTTIGKLWYLPGGMLLFACGSFLYHTWIKKDKKKLLFKTKKEFTKNQKINIIMSLLMSITLLAVIFITDFGLFTLKLSNGNELIEYQVKPMDYVKYFNQSTLETQYYEVLQIMIVNSMMIIGVSITMICSLIKSRMFVIIGSSTLLIGLIIFVLIIQSVLAGIGLEQITIDKVIISLGIGYYILLVLAGIILLNNGSRAQMNES